MAFTNDNTTKVVFAPSTSPKSIGVGVNALQAITVGGDSNTAVGYAAGTAITTGSNNVVIGTSEVPTLTTGSNNIIIGSGIDVSVASTSNTLNIGTAITATGLGSTNAVTFPGNVSFSGNVTVSGNTKISGNFNYLSSSQLIAGRCGVPGQQGAIGAGTPYLKNHTRHFAPYGADAIQLVYGPFYLNGGNGEFNMPPSMFQAVGVTYTNGTLYAVGDVDTFAVTNTTGMAACKVMITAVSAGVPTQVQVVDGGLYNTPLGAGVSPASTTGSGTGATATFTWIAGAIGMRIGIEPTWNTLAANGAGAVERAKIGFVPTAGNPGFQNQANLLVPMGGFLVTDLMPIDVPIGGYFGIRAMIGYNTPQMGRIPISATFAPGAPTANREAAEAITPFVDTSVSGTIGTTRNSALMTPIAILGIPKKIGPTYAILGDSRAYGVTTSSVGSISGLDAMDNDGNLGWFEKALSALNGGLGAPFSNLSRQSDTITRMVYTTDLGGKGRLEAIARMRPTAVCLDLNYNDLLSGNAATIQTYEQQVIGELRGLGVRYVFTSTTDPNTTSTDSWATTVNQTTTTKSADILTRNNALVAGTWASYDFYIDQRANVESSIGSGLWRVNGTANFYTGDGVHGGNNAITLKAATAATTIAANVVL